MLDVPGSPRRGEEPAGARGQNSYHHHDGAPLHTVHLAPQLHSGPQYLCALLFCSSVQHASMWDNECMHMGLCAAGPGACRATAVSPQVTTCLHHQLLCMKQRYSLGSKALARLCNLQRERIVCSQLLHGLQQTWHRLLPRLEWHVVHPRLDGPEQTHASMF